MKTLIKVNKNLPVNTIEFRDITGKLVGKIIHLAEPEPQTANPLFEIDVGMWRKTVNDLRIHYDRTNPDYTVRQYHNLIKDLLDKINDLQFLTTFKRKEKDINSGRHKTSSKAIWPKPIFFDFDNGEKR